MFGNAEEVNGHCVCKPGYGRVGPEHECMPCHTNCASCFLGYIDNYSDCHECMPGYLNASVDPMFAYCVSDCPTMSHEISGRCVWSTEDTTNVVSMNLTGGPDLTIENMGSGGQ
jgi:hypothetical protein